MSFVVKVEFELNLLICDLPFIEKIKKKFDNDYQQ